MQAQRLCGAVRGKITCSMAAHRRQFIFRRCSAIDCRRFYPACVGRRRSTSRNLAGLGLKAEETVPARRSAKRTRDRIYRYASGGQTADLFVEYVLKTKKSSRRASRLQHFPLPWYHWYRPSVLVNHATRSRIRKLSCAGGDLQALRRCFGWCAPVGACAVGLPSDWRTIAAGTALHRIWR